MPIKTEEENNIILFFDKLLMEQTNNFDICNQTGEPWYTVEGDIIFGSCAKVYARGRKEVATVVKEGFDLGAKYVIYHGNAAVGSIKRKETFFGPKFVLDFKSWSVKGDPSERDFSICGRNGEIIATVHKKNEHDTCRYSLSIDSESDTLDVVVVAIVIDADRHTKDIIHSEIRRFNRIF